MGAQLTYEQRKYKIYSSFQQKRYELKKRIEKKYEDKVNREYERKVRHIDKKQEDALHNLKVELPTDKRKRKLRVKTKSRTSIKKDLWEWWSRKVRLDLSYRAGNTYYAHCYTHPTTLLMKVVERDDLEGRYKWFGTQPGHMIKKGSGDALKFYTPVIRMQCKKCNLIDSADQKMREEMRHKEVGDEEYEKALKLKATEFTMTADEMLKLKEECKKYVEEKLEDLKNRRSKDQ